MRQAKVERQTLETTIELSLCLDGQGVSRLSTGCGFLEHMLALLAKHAGFDLDIKARGDVQVDYHHLTEDIGICLGSAFRSALATKEGIARYGTVFIPMDEALAMVSLDLSNRPYLHWQVPLPASKVGDFDTELVEEFMRAFANHAGITLHVNLQYGHNTHHIIEAVFKALAHALRIAVSRDSSRAGVLSSKGSL